MAVDRFFENWEERRRGSSIQVSFKGLLKAALSADLGEAQKWHRFITYSYPKDLVEAEFEKLFQKETL